MRKKGFKIVRVFAGFLILLVIILIGSGVSWMYLSSPVDKNNDDDIVIEIPSGSSSIQIGNLLYEKGLIKNTFIFRAYIYIYKPNSLKASTYTLKKSMDLESIIKNLSEGNSYNPDEISLTFKEGIRITDYAKVISDNTNNSYDDVIAIFTDKDYTKSLISQYWFLSDDILDDSIYYPLEGYLAPNTYAFKNKDVDAKTIIDTLLKETDKKLSKYKNNISSDIHTYMTMASIVELEGTNAENRKMIVGIFNNRLESKMNLGSDVTTYYALQADMKNDLSSKDFNTVNPYNTRSTTMIGKMPVGPICNPSIESIEASINPTESDYLYFVADKHGNIFYTKTIKEHEAKVAEIKKNGDWIF